MRCFRAAVSLRNKGDHMTVLHVADPGKSELRHVEAKLEALDACRTASRTGASLRVTQQLVACSLAKGILFHHQLPLEAMSLCVNLSIFAV